MFPVFLSLTPLLANYRSLGREVLPQPPATSLILASFVLLLVLFWILALLYTSKYHQDVFQLDERLRNMELSVE